ncbi:hypothetical protein DL546_008819 [Coniochaeta pulveracea]|uniref:F-box domain-containing protein n=1 Tax=Coniochaeta pulveracea TaxID=177199 RepID=A0A420YF11_9PEZI|nr:hypothetical protein DL546_008819 [Coniochaeta pulveracea]
MEESDLIKQSFLIGLPGELVEKISTWLRKSDLKRFRLTCKAINEATLHHFRQRFFTKRFYMLNERSLNNLLEISQHPFLSRGVKTIGMMPYQVRKPRKPPIPDNQESLQWYDAYTRQELFLNRNQDRDMLTEAFRNLPSLQKLLIAPGFWGKELFDIHEVKRCFGIAHLPVKKLQETSMDHCNRLFRTTIIAMIDAHTSPACILATPSPVPGLYDSSFRLSMNSRPELSNSLRNLRTLHLELDVWDERERKHDPSALEPTAGIMEPNHSLFAQKFLGSAPNLVKLRVSMQEQEGNCCVDDQFISWFAQCPGTPPSGPTWGSNPKVAPIHFRFLTVLVLECFKVSLENLKALVVKVGPTLRRLRLGGFTLVCPEEAPQNTDAPAGWSRIFRLLAHSSELESIQLTNLVSCYPRVNAIWYNVCCHEVPYFAGMRRLLGYHGIKSCVNVSYRGPDMEGFLENLASNMTEGTPSQRHQHDFDNLGTDPCEMSDCETDICDDDSSVDSDGEDEDGEGEEDDDNDEYDDEDSDEDNDEDNDEDEDDGDEAEEDI